jgi:hypothetical protein
MVQREVLQALEVLEVAAMEALPIPIRLDLLTLAVEVAAAAKQPDKVIMVLQAAPV